ncbi:MAG TPA: HAMP domain-containing sensor histidine kinase [Candidatus Binatia bacterium]|nr:HAMP domain-containing sensor histidine kinase [Candidatus Binatia bacterium]
MQQIAVFFGTVVVIFGIFAGGVWLISQRLTTEATLQTAVLMARQVEIALADSLRQRPAPPTRVVQSQPSGSFWSFLGNIFPGTGLAPKTKYIPGRPAPRDAEVKGLMEAFVNRSGGIEAMWVLNADGKILYSSIGHQKGEALTDPKLRNSLRRGVTTINTQRQPGKAAYYDVLVPLQMPAGVDGPGGLRLWINPADWTEMLSGLGRQLMLLFALGGGVALLSAFLTTALYTRRFRLISETLRQAEAGTYQTRPRYRSHDEVGTSLDLIDRLVMKQRKTAGAPAPMQRLAYAARTLAHEVRTPLNALAIHLELLRNTGSTGNTPNGQQEKSINALDASIRQVDRLVREFSDYSAPVTMQKKSVDVSEVLATSLEAVAAQCATKNISLEKDLVQGPWTLQGDGTRLRQCFDNLLRNAMEAQPDGGAIRVSASKNGKELVLRFADSGPGVAPEHREDLFEFGKTTKIGGSGIGLPLSQLIVESHGGALVYEDQNAANSGATFRLTLSLEEN